MYGEQLCQLLQALKVASPKNPDALAGAYAAITSSYKGYKDHALKSFLGKVSCGAVYPATGADDNQGQVFFKTLAAICCDPTGDCLEPIIRFHQNNDLAVCASWAYFTFVLGLLNGQSAQEATGAALEKVEVGVYFSNLFK